MLNHNSIKVGFHGREKMLYRKKNIYTFEELLEVLDISTNVTVRKTEPGNFKDYATFFGLFYSDFKKKVEINHLFSCNSNNWQGNHFMTNLRTSVIEGILTLNHNSIKVGFHGRDSHPMNGKCLKAAIAARSANIKACMETELKWTSIV